MIIVDPFVICRRGGGCIWIRSKLSECDMCSMRQGHRATGQTCKFSHPFLLHHATFGFQKLDFFVRQKIYKNCCRNSVQSEKSNNFRENLTMCTLILLHHSRENSYRVSTPLRQGLVKGHTVMLTHQPFCTKNCNHLFPSTQLSDLPS